MSATDRPVRLKATREALAELAGEALADVEYMSRSHVHDAETPSISGRPTTGPGPWPRTAKHS
jgi:hypothetical protein